MHSGFLYPDYGLSRRGFPNPAEKTNFVSETRPCARTPKTFATMDNILTVDTVDQYNKLFGHETLHPLVSVVDFSRARPLVMGRMHLGFYAVFLKEVKCGDLRYGRQYYDYQEGTVVCIAPGQVVGVESSGEPIQPRGYGLIFHPDLIRGTQLGREIRNYSFFAYESREALHLSESERRIFLDCLEKIGEELRHDIDKHSKRLIVRNIELLLDYCTRFYDRQFITRSDVHHDTVSRFDGLIDDYFRSGEAERSGVPTVRYFADKVCLSPNYFGDLVKKETGKTALEYIQLKMLAVAKERLAQTTLTVTEIAYGLGFQYPQHFSRLFKKGTGLTPNEYRREIC